MIDEIVRHPRARRIRLVMDPVTGSARLVVPRRAALKPALAWAESKADWLAAQRARLPQPSPFADGTVIRVDDRDLTIRWTPGARRTIVREGDTLSAEGPPETLSRRIEAWLRRHALMLLAQDTAHYAALADVRVAKVAIGDAKGRWGSCASSGTIRYSWRLVLAPRFVRRATVAHEVAHRVHMNHGAAFHALVAKLYAADPGPARQWLREHGTGLHWVGRSS